MKRIITVCLIVLFVIASPFVACSAINQINRAEAMRKTEAIAKQLGVADEDILGGFDACAPIIIESGGCAWVFVATTADDLTTFEAKVNSFSAHLLKKERLVDPGSVILSTLNSVAYAGNPSIKNAATINGFARHQIDDPTEKLVVQEYAIYRWLNFPDGGINDANINFNELSSLSDVYTFKGKKIRGNVIVIAYTYRQAN